MSDESKEQRVEKRKLKMSIYTLVVLNVFFIGLIFTSAFFLCTEDRDFLVYNPLPQFCLPCEKLLLHPDDPHDGIEFQANGTICCATNKASIPILVEKVTGRWVKEYLYKESPEYHGCKTEPVDDERNNPEKEYFKVLGYRTKRLTDSHRGHVHWDRSSIISSKNFSYDHGHVYIHVSGVYQIYSQLIADYHAGPSIVEGASKFFIHKVITKKNGTHKPDKILVSSTMSECATDPENALFVSHVETVYQLWAGETVAVQVSHPEDILPNPTMNFLGLHMI